MRVTLRVLEGPYRGREFTFDQHDTFLIGRSDNAHLYLPDDRFFSRHHCLLEIAPPRCFLRDLGSTNGTFVNGQKVSEVFLRSGDRIQGGETVLEVQVVADAVETTVENSETLAGPVMVTVECTNCGRRDRAEASPGDKLTFICEECREELKRRPPPVPGYEMIKMLGRGGMGCVMLARDESSGQQVAIKTLLPEVAVADKSLRRFMREIEVAAALQHPNIVRFVKSGTHNVGLATALRSYIESENTLQSFTPGAAGGGFGGRGGGGIPAGAVQVIGPYAPACRLATRFRLSRKHWTRWRTLTPAATSIAISRSQTFSLWEARRISRLS